MPTSDNPKLMTIGTENCVCFSACISKSAVTVFVPAKLLYGNSIVTSRSNTSPGLSENEKTDGVSSQPLGPVSFIDPLMVDPPEFVKWICRVCGWKLDSKSG